MSGVPDEVRQMLRDRVRRAAAAASWGSITNLERASLYDQWTDDPQIGGVVGRYVDRSQIRVYIKDTLLKRVAQDLLADPARAMRVLRVATETEVATEYRQPYGRAFADGRLIAWGAAEHWRLVLTAIHERAWANPALRPYGAVLMRAAGRFHEDRFRAMVDDARRKLGIEKLAWLET